MGLYYVVEQTQVGFLIRIFSDREKKRRLSISNSLENIPLGDKITIVHFWAFPNFSEIQTSWDSTQQKQSIPFKYFFKISLE